MQSETTTIKKEENKILKDEREKEKGNAIFQWIAINNNQHTMKIICISLLGLTFLLCALSFSLHDKTPIVVLDVNGEHYYHVGSKKSVVVQKGNIKRFINRYIEFRYEWGGKLDIEKISKNISPLVTEGFRKKVTQKLKNLENKELKGKSIDQGHTKPKVEISNTSTIASFDRVLRINGVSLPISTQVLFHLVRGKVTEWNKLGLYINGVTIHEGT